MSEKAFPVIQMTICILAAGVYLYNGDLRRAIYWIAAAVLTAAVTF